MKRIRQLHLWLGLFFAPFILFFAFTGSLQVLGLHENKTPGSHHPEWIAKLGSIHKNQRLPTKPAYEQAKPAQSRPVQAQTKEASPQSSTWALKFFVLLMSCGLILSSCLGMYMAFKYNRDRRVIWSLLLGGTFLPVLLLLL